MCTKVDQLTNEQQSLQLELVSVYEELDTLRPLKKVEADYKKALDKIENYESYKEEWQSELSKAMDKLEITKTELSNVNNQLESSENEKTQVRHFFGVLQQQSMNYTYSAISFKKRKFLEIALFEGNIFIFLTNLYSTN